MIRIGYPCQNKTIGCGSVHSFRLASFTEERCLESIRRNVACVEQILAWNVAQGVLFFRITSELVPFATHPINTLSWEEIMTEDLARIGEYARKNKVRISMHPDQFVLLNSPDETIVSKSIADLAYHSRILDLMGQGSDAKIQIHVGGVYGDKQGAMDRFVKRYEQLPDYIKRRLIIENDDRLYSVQDCLALSEKTGVPILFDTFHHELLNDGESVRDACERAGETWRRGDGTPMIDYSSQEPGARRGKHADHIDLDHFKRIMNELRDLERDVMLEIKDKEVSVLAAISHLKNAR